MLIYAFVELFPDTFKPYYDAQFIQFLQDGHDLRIFAQGKGHTMMPERHYRELGMADRTTYLPQNELRKLHHHLPQIFVGAISSLASINALTRVNWQKRNWKRRLTEGGRLLSMPSQAPDICLVHSLESMHILSWLKILYPRTTVAMYYHGGRPAELGATSNKDENVLGAADVVFTNTNHSREEILRKGYDPEKVFVVPVGIDTGAYAASTERSYGHNDRFNLVSVGRLNEDKGTLFAIMAVQELVRAGDDRISFKIIGDGVCKPMLEEYVRENRLDGHVQFLGALPNHKTMEIVGLSDALVLSSLTTPHWAETQAVVVQEALLAGALVITTRTGGVPESIPRQFDEYCVAEASSTALAHAMSAVRGLSDAEKKSLGQAGRQWVIDNYDVSRTNRKLLDLIPTPDPPR